MDFSITWLIIVLILLIIEMRLASKWSAFYFKRGIQIYGKENYYVNNDKSLEQISNLLNNAFKGKGFSPSIHFNPIDNKTVAFREKIFELSLFSYTPLMHGTIEINSNKVQVVGLANWYPLAFLVLWYSFLFPSFKLGADIKFLLAPVFFFGIIYIIQSRKYRKIMTQLINIK